MLGNFKTTSYLKKLETVHIYIYKIYGNFGTSLTLR